MPAKRKTRSKTSKRTAIEPHKGDRRYVRRNKKGQFKKEVNVRRSLPADRRRKSKRKVKPGQGDRGDTRRRDYAGGATSIRRVTSRVFKPAAMSANWALCLCSHFKSDAISVNGANPHSSPLALSLLPSSIC